jgi:hypothetical protein
MVNKNNITLFNLMNFVDAGNWKIICPRISALNDSGNFFQVVFARSLHSLSKVRVKGEKKKAARAALLRRKKLLISSPVRGIVLS